MLHELQFRTDCSAAQSRQIHSQKLSHPKNVVEVGLILRSEGFVFQPSKNGAKRSNAFFNTETGCA